MSPARRIPLGLQRCRRRGQLRYSPHGESSSPFLPRRKVHRAKVQRASEALADEERVERVSEMREPRNQNGEENCIFRRSEEQREV